DTSPVVQLRKKPVRNRSAVLELAVLGLLHTARMHGYQLRKRLNEMLGMLRPFSYGSLYPCLKALAARGLIEASEDPEDPSGQGSLAGSRRGRIVYGLTKAGRSHLESLLGQAGPASWEDENFDVRFALFAQTDAVTRLRILEGRRARMAERLERARTAVRRGPGADQYAQELQRHAIDQVEREVRWLEELIDWERGTPRENGHLPIRGWAAGPETTSNKENL
ncbi:MAG: PadR family transcriptional regulator, partial [Bifidobacteriaceae bacterium]|nr:PadR family transcriptional regulator [Bifidobacteriaceae bacterium]